MMYAARWAMAASLDEKEVDALIEKYRALAEKGQQRANELEEQNAHLLDTIVSSLIVPASAYGLSFARAYYGERASILGIPIDAAVGLFLKGLAALLGFFSDKGAQVAAKVAHDVANGAIASWSAAAGAELGLKKRMEKPVPLPLPNTGAAELPPVSSRALTHEDLAAITGAVPLPNTRAAEIPPRSSRALTHEDLAAITGTMALNTQPAPPPVAAPPPMPMPAQQSPPRPPLNGHPAPVMASAAPAATSTLPPTHQKPFRFTQRWPVNPEADMRGLLQSVGAPADPNTVNHLLSHENPGDEFKVILQRARAPS